MKTTKIYLKNGNRERSKTAKNKTRYSSGFRGMISAGLPGDHSGELPGDRGPCFITPVMLNRQYLWGH